MIETMLDLSRSGTMIDIAKAKRSLVEGRVNVGMMESYFFCDTLEGKVKKRVERAKGMCSCLYR